MLQKKKILLLLFMFVIATLFLFGCNVKGNALYECQITASPTGKTPCNFAGGQTHICQIYDNNFNPENGVPDFCTEKCLDRSEFLTNNNFWNQALDLDCIEISLAHSSFVEGVQYDEKIIETIKLTYEENNEDDKNNEQCNSDSDIGCCLSEGKCWVDNSCNDCGKGECQFDSDCAPICQSTQLIKRWCNPETAKCELEAETFRTDCSVQKDLIGDTEFSRICQGSACIIDSSALEKVTRDDLRDQYNQYTFTRQDVTNLRLKFNEHCLRALSDVTNKFIIDTALWMSGISSSTTNLVSTGVSQMIDTGLNLMNSDKNKMSTEEFIVYSCSMDKVLTQELKLLDKKQEKILDEIKNLN